MRRFAAIAIPIVGVVAVLVQALFAFGSMSSGAYQGLAIAIVLLLAIGFAALACIGIVHWLSRLN